MLAKDNRPKKEKAWEKHERLVAKFMNDILLPPGWKAERPTASVKYSDILIHPPRGSKLPNAWVEVKMSHSDNLFNARPSYIGGKFVYPDEDSGVKEFVIEQMTSNSKVKEFIKKLGDFLGRTNFDIVSASPGKLDADVYISNRLNISNSGRLKIANEETIQAYNHRNDREFKWSSVDRIDSELRPAVSWYEFKDFFTKHPGGQTFADLLPAGSATEFTEKATTHYNDGKATPVHYIQTGNDFYFMGDTGDPLGLGIAIPIWSAKGNFKIRISLGKNEKVDDRGGRTEIMPELKAESVVHTSAFSCDYRRGNKRNPFEIPWEIYQYNL
jgi:hypothetical protein